MPKLYRFIYAFNRVTNSWRVYLRKQEEAEEQDHMTAIKVIISRCRLLPCTTSLATALVWNDLQRMVNSNWNSWKASHNALVNALRPSPSRPYTPGGDLT